MLAPPRLTSSARAWGERGLHGDGRVPSYHGMGRYHHHEPRVCAINGMPRCTVVACQSRVAADASGRNGHEIRCVDASAIWRGEIFRSPTRRAEAGSWRRAPAKPHTPPAAAVWWRARRRDVARAVTSCWASPAARFTRRSDRDGAVTYGEHALFCNELPRGRS